MRTLIIQAYPASSRLSSIRVAFEKLMHTVSVRQGRPEEASLHAAGCFAKEQGLLRRACVTGGVYSTALRVEGFQCHEKASCH